MIERVREVRETVGGGVRSMGGFIVLLAVAALGCGDSGERAAGQMLDALDRGKITGTKGTMEAIAQGLRTYSVDHSGYPEADSIDALMAELVPAYMRVAVTLDAWGGPISYRGEGDSFTLVSSGQDGNNGTSDDIVMIDGRFETASVSGGS